MSLLRFGASYLFHKSQNFGQLLDQNIEVLGVGRIGPGIIRLDVFAFCVIGSPNCKARHKNRAVRCEYWDRPGLRTLGWASNPMARVSHVANGLCHSDEDDLGERLLSLHNQVMIIDAYQPDQAAIEQTFVNKDEAGTLKLGQARCGC